MATKKDPCSEVHLHLIQLTPLGGAFCLFTNRKLVTASPSIKDNGLLVSDAINDEIHGSAPSSRTLSDPLFNEHQLPMRRTQPHNCAHLTSWLYSTPVLQNVGNCYS